MAEIPSELIGLIGIVLGFTLGEGSHYIRYRLRIRHLKIVVREELRSIRAQLDQKMDIINQAIDKLTSREVLSTRSVHAVTSGYRSVLRELYGHLTDRERNCLHVIYERLRLGDEVMDQFENDLTTALKEKILADPFAAYANRLRDTLKMYEVTSNLIFSFLNEKPTEVFPSRVAGQ